MYFHGVQFSSRFAAGLRVRIDRRHHWAMALVCHWWVWLRCIGQHVCFNIVGSCFVYVALMLLFSSHFNMVRWTWWDWSLSLGHHFLLCFDTVGWVIWPVKTVPDMTYNVFSGTLNPTQSINPIQGDCLPRKPGKDQELKVCARKIWCSDIVGKKLQNVMGSCCCCCCFMFESIQNSL